MWTLPWTHLLHLPTQIRFPIGGERVTWRGSKLTNSLGKQQRELSTRTRSGRAPWNRGKFVSQLVKSKRFIFFAVFPSLELGGNKTLNNWSRGKQWVLFPLDLNISLGFATGNIEGTGLGATKTHYFLKLTMHIRRRCTILFTLERALNTKTVRRTCL